MKKIYLVLTAIAAFTFTKSNAQFYSQGDVTVVLQPSGSHDSTTCSSQGQMMYMITINNSFVGDSVKVKDMFGGFIVYEEANTTGQNPWNVYAPVFNAFGYVSDDQVFGNVATFGGPINKVISGPDTIFNINNGYQIPVPNPCQYGSVSGNVYVDYNNDCSFNGSDVALTSVAVATTENLNSPSMSGISYYGYSNGSGNYTMNALQTWMTNYTVSIPSFYQFIFPSTSCSPVVYNYTTLPQANVDFSLQCTSLMDVQCGAGSQGVVRPNQPFTLSPYVNNTGCNMASGLLKLVLDPNVVYNSALSSNPASVVVGDTLIWSYYNLTSLSNGAYWNSFFAGVHLTPNSSVTSGSTLCFRVLTNVPTGDVDATNNDISFCLPVVNSYDPNLKEVSPKGTGIAGNIPATTDELTYTIHFQNTGTAPAISISVIDTLDTDISAASLKILGTSHLATPQWLAPGVVKFVFNNIYLPDSTSNEPLSHGFVRFSVKLNSSLPVGTVIQNRASIYFDSNPAIVTNRVTNTLSSGLGINEMSSSNGMISVYPNPMSEDARFVIQSDNLSDTYSFELTDVLGKEVKSIKAINTKEFTISRSGLISGVYFYKVLSTNGMIGIGKLVIE